MAKTANFANPMLPYPLRTVMSCHGPVQVYDIPEADKAAVLEKVYIFRPIPDLDDVMEDIECEKTFKVREFMVTREGPMNVLGSPYYLESGGTVIDWWSVRRARKKKKQASPGNATIN